eukprot:CAMPEP_0173353414 /NCGR_PEP_ID=MMETSP1144-20121109/16600_1 /TAXON_ID=483371 /ORGANISM="non described non described, Strain CCMP2298" /LENGTH=61 /DNA_ID=CAMNT_0014301817 /DNA_START=473 /DNA_END=655 /DNA_ORIENTATION=-
MSEPLLTWGPKPPKEREIALFPAPYAHNGDGDGNDGNGGGNGNDGGGLSRDGSRGSNSGTG